MKRIVVALIVAAVLPAGARPADLPRLPTSPQVPAPSSAPGSISARSVGQARERISLVDSANPSETPSAPAWIEPSMEALTCHAPGQSCGGSVIHGSPIKSWLFYRPTTAHALPWLRPHPYVGPITGQYHCLTKACPPCEGAPACAPGTACGKGLIGGRGCRDGTCVPPPDGVFAGYKFAAPLSPAVTGRTGAAVTSTSYKPGVEPTGVSTPSAERTGTVLNSLRKSFSKP